MPAFDRPSGKRIVTALGRYQLLHQRGVYDTGPFGDALKRVDEVGHIGDPALEQVSDAAPTGQQLHCVLDVDMREDARPLLFFRGTYLRIGDV